MEVLWPGGVRNRLAGERLVLPEIPCDAGGAFAGRGDYARCVTRALGELVAAGVIDEAGRARLQASALAP